MTALNGRTPGVLSAGQHGPGTRLSVMEQPVDASLSYSDQHKEEAHSHGCLFLFLAVASAMWCQGPAPADPGYSKRGRRRRGSGYNSFN